MVRPEFTEQATPETLKRHEAASEGTGVDVRIIAESGETYQSLTRGTIGKEIAVREGYYGISVIASDMSQIHEFHRRDSTLRDVPQQ